MSTKGENIQRAILCNIIELRMFQCKNHGNVWNEEEHPRVTAGNSEGGQFTDAAVDISGHKLEKGKEERLKKTAAYFKNKLGIKGRVEIHVIKGEDINGLNLAEVEWVQDWKIPGKYSIGRKINIAGDVDESDFSQIIGHEMKHIQQSQTGMSYFMGEDFYWDNKPYINKKEYNTIIRGLSQTSDRFLRDEAKRKYRALPWEKDADEYVGRKSIKSDIEIDIIKPPV